jgi:glycosyltransferase involved in cell wall biosynthesis
MRTNLFRRAGSEVTTVVVPVGGRLPPGVPTAPHRTVAWDAETVQVGTVALFGDPVWRDRLVRAGQLPPRAAPPALAGAVASVLEGERPFGLHVMRSYLAPLGAALAERLGVEWATLDLDEDEGPGADGLLAVFGPLFGGLSAASADEADAIGARLGLDVTHIPNAVDVPALRPRARSTPISLVFVGNLTYPPNVEAALTLVFDVLPALERPARVTLAGPDDGHLASVAGPRVEVAGFVPDLAEVYASADIAVVPLQTGAGTRIKILEAFAHGVPVVASTVAAAGIDCRDGEHLLIVDGPRATAAAIDRLVSDEALAERLADAAYTLVRDRYSTGAVIPAIRDLFSRAAR